MATGRLPSPPPAPEIQLTPDNQSPLGLKGSPHNLLNSYGELDQQVVEQNSQRRIHPGTKAEDIEAGPPLIALSEVCLERHP
jgi:hypothetical protein